MFVWLVFVAAAIFSFTLTSTASLLDGVTMDDPILTELFEWSGQSAASRFGTPDPQYLNGDKYGIHLSRNETQEMEYRLKWAVRRMQYFVRMSNTHARGFERMGEFLRGEISNISEWMERKEILSAVFSKRIGFANRIFQALVNYSEGLGYFNSDSTEHFLVRSVLFFNTKVLALFDRLGDPDVTIEGYRQKVTALRYSLEYWAGQFNQLTDVSLTASGVFASQLAEAKHTLNTLSSAVTG